MNRDAGMEPDAGCLRRAVQGFLKLQMAPPQSSVKLILTNAPYNPQGYIQEKKRLG
jgi:hypothetical protein